MLGPLPLLLLANLGTSGANHWSPRPPGAGTTRRGTCAMMSVFHQTLRVCRHRQTRCARRTAARELSSLDSSLHREM